MKIKEALEYFDKTLSNYLLVNGKIYNRYKAIIYLIKHEDDEDFNVTIAECDQDGYEI